MRDVERSAKNNPAMCCEFSRVGKRYVVPSGVMAHVLQDVRASKQDSDDATAPTVTNAKTMILYALVCARKNSKEFSGFSNHD